MALGNSVDTEPDRMNSLASSQFSPPNTRFSELGAVSAKALRLVRLWFWGQTHQSNLRIALSVQQGAKQARCIAAALANLERTFGPNAPFELQVLSPDTDRVSADELSLLAMLDASLPADVGGVGDMPLLRHGNAVHQSVGALRVLGQMLQERAKKTVSGCPMACPSRSSCPDRAKLKVVK